MLSGRRILRPVCPIIIWKIPCLYNSEGDLSDSSSLIRVINIVQPDEIYNLAAQSHVQVSFDVPEYSGDVDELGVLRLLEGIRILGMEKTCRFYQASTSELYGKVEEVPQKGPAGSCRGPRTPSPAAAPPDQTAFHRQWNRRKY